MGIFDLRKMSPQKPFLVYLWSKCYQNINLKNNWRFFPILTMLKQNKKHVKKLFFNFIIGTLPYFLCPNTQYYKYKKIYGRF